MYSYWRRLFALFVLVLCCVFPAQARRACNNSPLLCNRKYNQITHLAAHDSPFVRNSSNFYTPAGDQFYTSLTQLAAGVRMLSAQVHAFKSGSGQQEWRLCHTYCELYDAGTLRGWLSGIKRWLDRNENEVVTILLVNSDDASASDLDTEFQAANIAHYAYTPADTTQPTTEWPTLNQLISMNKRLVVFMASLDPTTNTVAPYLLDEFTFIFENNYDVTDPDGFSCTANRPDEYANRTQAALASGRLPLMNHFMYLKVGGIEIPAVGRVQNTNAPKDKPGNLGDAADECTRVYGAPPPFIFVDFFNVGPALATVDRLNGIQGHIVGRKHVSEQKRPNSQSMSSAGPVTRSTSSSADNGSHEHTSPKTPASTAMTTSSPTTSPNGASRLRNGLYGGLGILPVGVLVAIAG